MKPQRLYNKLYVDRNREDGIQNILLGYKHDKKEIVLHKDTETYFHVPVLSEPIRLVDSNLVEGGAVGGPFPAASDRIYKNQENYGNYTPYGDSTTSDGMWFCSWLYYNPITRESSWLDRFYNPGQFNYNKAIDELTLAPSYQTSNPVFVDRPSRMVFEQGVLYKYFHVGEKTYQQLVSTLAGLSSERLLMSLTDWTSPSAIDISNNKLPVKLQTNGTNNFIFTVDNTKETFLFSDVVDFDNAFTTDLFVDYDSKYLPENEFTLGFWTNSDRWKENSFTHLVGNYSSRGEGVSISIEDSTATPVMVIPETYYGHLLFLNEKGEGFLDKNLQDGSARTNPSLFAIDSENNVVVCDLSGTSVIFKVDQAGDILATTKDYLDEVSMFNFLTTTERPIQMLCGENDWVHILTTNAVYTLDDSLHFVKSAPHKYSNTVMAFSYNKNNSTVRLEVVDDVNDVKFIEQTKWSIKTSDGNLYKNDILHQTFLDKASKLAIGPDDNIWILHGDNKVSIVDPNADTNKTIKQTLTVGSPISILKPVSRQRNINFINQFDRDTNTRKYICVIYYSDERILYYYSLEGVLQNIVYINELFNTVIIQKKKQKYSSFTFEGTGDFTSYENKRVFKNASTFANKQQLILRVGLKDQLQVQTSYKLFKRSTPIDEWQDQSWHFISLTLKNRTYTLYIDGIEKIKFPVTGRHVVTYNTQPAFRIGSAVGNKEGFNNEVQYTSNIFNGKIADVKIYDYALTPDQLNFFLQASNKSENVFWMCPTPSIQYVEQIERVYKHKLPGFKSNLFNLKLLGTQITDPKTRKIIEDEIRMMVEKTKPAYIDLLKIEWID